MSVGVAVGVDVGVSVGVPLTVGVGVSVAEPVALGNAVDVLVLGVWLGHPVAVAVNVGMMTVGIDGKVGVAHAGKCCCVVVAFGPEPAAVSPVSPEAIIGAYA